MKSKILLALSSRQFRFKAFTNPERKPVVDSKILRASPMSVYGTRQSLKDLRHQPMSRGSLVEYKILLTSSPPLPGHSLFPKSVYMHKTQTTSQMTTKPQYLAMLPEIMLQSLYTYNETLNPRNPESFQIIFFVSKA